MSNLDYWRGDEGNLYTLRQPETHAADSLQRIIRPWASDIHTVLEVGCNRGDNLGAFDCDVVGVEPNLYARKIARERGYGVMDAPAHSLPFPDNTFDLVFTVGVLIHIPPYALEPSLKEIFRVSRRYILAVEYESPTVKPIDYRGVRAGIWKRPYGLEYTKRFPGLTVEGKGLAGECFDGCRWWMLEKHPLALAA